MVLDGTKEASKRLASMFFFGMSTTEFQEGATRNEGAIFAIKELWKTNLY
jgi:urocanate hydratase